MLNKKNKGGKKMKKLTAWAIVLVILINLASMQVLTMAESVSVNNGWTITPSGSINPETHFAEFVNDVAYDGSISLHAKFPGDAVEGNSITVSQPMDATGNWSRTYEVIFYAKGDYDESGVLAGESTCKQDANPDFITIVALNNPKVTKTDAGDGWSKYRYQFRYGLNNTQFKFIFNSNVNEIWIDNLSVRYLTSSNPSSDDWKETGYALLTNGSFEEMITEEHGEAPSSYGWNVQLGSNSGAATRKFARVVDGGGIDGSKALFVAYNAQDWASNQFISLTTDIGTTSWGNSYTISLSIKGDYHPNKIEVGFTADDQLISLTNEDSSCNSENPYGDRVTAQDLGDGWTKYTMTISLANNSSDKLRIKIGRLCKSLWIDNLSVKWINNPNDVAKQLNMVKNGMFDNRIVYSQNVPAPDNWSIGYGPNNGPREQFFAQLDYNKGYNSPTSVYFTHPQNWVDNDYIDLSQPAIGLQSNETYYFSFYAKGGFNINNLNVGFSYNTIGMSNAAVTVTAMEDGWFKYEFPMQYSSQDKIRFVVLSYINELWIDNVSVKNSVGDEFVINGGFELNKKFNISDICFDSETQTNISKLTTGEITATLYLEKIDSNALPVYYCLVLYKDNMMEKIFTLGKVITTNEVEMLSLSVLVDDLSDGEYSIKALLWDDNLRPYMEYGYIEE
jgi:hypothetical protein